MSVARIRSIIPPLTGGGGHRYDRLRGRFGSRRSCDWFVVVDLVVTLAFIVALVIALVVALVVFNIINARFKIVYALEQSTHISYEILYAGTVVIKRLLNIHRPTYDE